MRPLVLPLVLFTSLAAFAEDHPGAALYKRKTCATCHAADGSGNTPVGKSLKTPDLRAADTQKKTDEELAAVVIDGKGKMPSFKSSVKPEELKDLVAYLRRLAPKS